MDVARWALVSIVLGSLGGCAVMDPYIRYESLQRLDGKVSGCLNGDNDQALKFACKAATRLEKARSEVVRTRSGLTAILFPIAGIVGYNSARGFNAPTNAALAAGGLAGYSAITTLAQQDRIHIYDNGLRSISCAIGVYELAEPGGSSAALRRATIKSEISWSLSTIGAIRAPAASDVLVVAKLDGLGAILVELRDTVEQLNPAAPLEAQLTALVHNTLAEVNAQLSQTLPSNADAFDGAVGALRSSQEQMPAIDSAKQTVEGMMASLDQPAFRAMRQLSSGSAAPLVGSLIDELEGRLQRIFEGLTALALESSQPSTADFEKCKYGLVASVKAQPTSQQLMLGAGDGLNGATITLPPKGTSDTRIFGGSPPYEIGRVGPESTIKVEIASKAGSPYLLIVAPDSPPDVEQSHVITLTDSGGWQSKKVLVKLPGK